MRARCGACLAFLTPDDVAGGRCPLCQRRLEKSNSSLPQTASPSPAPAKKLPQWLSVLYLLALIAFLPAFGFAVFFLTRYFAPEGWQPRTQEPDLRQLKAIQQQFHAVEERRVAERESEQRRLTQLLRNAKEDSTIEKVLFECYLKGGQAAALGQLEAQLAVDGVTLESLQNREKLSEASEELIAEIKRTAQNHPKAFRAANERFLDTTMPSRSKIIPKKR
jgi:hypothetical protein